MQKGLKMGKARDYIPALKYGNKILPSDLAGMLDLPTVGQIIYVDPTNGSDTANSGTEQNDAYATVTQAYAQAVSGQHDVVLISPTGGTGRTTEPTNITWAKRFTHLIGSAAPTQTNPRAGLSWGLLASGACFTQTNNGNIFRGLTIATFADNNVLFDQQGDYNWFGNVHFLGIGNDTTGDDTAGRSLVLTSAEENTFDSCTIGTDTVTRSAANASLESTGTCARNVFRNTYFPVFADAATPVFVKAATGNCNERFLVFEDCKFLNAVNGSSTTLTVGMDIGATGNGTIFILGGGTVFHGCTDIADTYTNLYTNIPTVGTANQGMAVIVAT